MHGSASRLPRRSHRRRRRIVPECAPAGIRGARVPARRELLVASGAARTNAGSGIVLPWSAAKIRVAARRTDLKRTALPEPGYSSAGLSARVWAPHHGPARRRCPSRRTASSGVSTPMVAWSVMPTVMRKPFSRARSCSSFSICSSVPAGSREKSARKAAR